MNKNYDLNFKFQISGCIVTYKNDIDILSKTIESFFSTDLNVMLYIVDNSPTNYLNCLVDKYKQYNFEYIFLNSNNGFGAGHNFIMRQIEKMGKYHLVLNPDIEFSKGVLDSLFIYMEHNPEIGNIMPKILYPNGQIQYLCKLLPSPKDWIIRRFIPIKRIREKIDYRFEMRFADYNQIMNVPYLSGCFMFLRTSVIREMGVFDERIFMYGEDTDLNRRIYQKYKTIYYPEVSIVHNFEKGSHKNMRLFWIHVKAAVYYLNKWGWFFDKERSSINKKTVKTYFK